MATATESKICTKCGTEPITGAGPWGKKCNAEYQREYQGTVRDQSARKGFHKGVEAMRRALVDEFLKAPPTGLMQTGDIVVFIASMPGPKWELQAMPTKEEALASVGDGGGSPDGNVDVGVSQV